MSTLGGRPGVGADDTPRLLTIAEPRLLSAGTPDVSARDRAWLVDASARVRLLGRGGAGFPVAIKLAAVGKGARIVVNGSESEPASWKDRALMRCHPDLVIAGVDVVAEALRSTRVLLAVGDARSASALKAAVRRRGSRAEVRLVHQRFVGGEIGALISGLDEGNPVPQGVKSQPHRRGLDGRPTYASNVETFAQLALLSALGPERYAATGTAAEPGTSLVTLHGTDHDGVLEVSHGLQLRRLLGDRNGPVLIGGYHGTWTTRHDLVVERPALRGAGVGWGAGVVAVLPEETCPVGEIARVGRWLADQSARQCGPCTFGLPTIAADLERLATGRAVDSEQLRRRLGQVTGRGACHHPTGAIGFIASGLNAFDADVRRHLAGRPCGRTVRGALPIAVTR